MPQPVKNSPTAQRIAQEISILGKTPAYLLLILSVSTINQRIGLVLLASLIVTEIVNAAIKNTVRRERPGSRTYSNLEGRYSFPSCHTQNATVFWGLLAYISSHPLIALLCALVITAIAWSRLRLAEHYPTDVFAGFVFGTLQLTLIVNYVFL